MSKRININKCFSVLRNLPLAVSLEQMEDWIKDQKKIPSDTQHQPKPWLGKLFNSWSSN